jgi:hypothetical protein
LTGSFLESETELVALDEPVIRVGREGDRRQFERVDDRQVKASQSRVLARSCGTSWRRRLWPTSSLAPFRCRIDAPHDICRVKSTGREAHDAIAVRPDRADLEDPVTVRRVGFDVDRKR